jgi:hypothetical protein
VTEPEQKTVTCHCTCPDCWHGCCHIALDDLTDDDLDELYKRRDMAEATLARVHAYAVHAIDAGDTGPGPTLGRLLLQLLDGDQAATEATRPATWLTVETRDLSTPTPDHPPAPCPACRRADQAGLAPAEQHNGCVNQETR